MSLNTSDIINIAKVSQLLASEAVGSGVLFGSTADPQLPEAIYTERKSVEWLYGLDANNGSLAGSSQYLLALCGRYYITAQTILNGNSGGSVVPVNPTTNPNVIFASGSDFADATNYNNTLLAGRTFWIFFNDINRAIINPAEWVYTSTGFNVLINGFNASANPSYLLIITIIN